MLIRKKTNHLAIKKSMTVFIMAAMMLSMVQPVFADNEQNAANDTNAEEEINIDINNIDIEALKKGESIDINDLGVEGLDQKIDEEINEAGEDADRQAKEIDRLNKQKTESLVWKIVIGVLILAIFAVGIVSNRKRNADEDGSEENEADNTDTVL
ncbi:MAG: hypothetical protein K5868_02650 [Lachnospiraceae bacterium]|nr:hypothetical protein [Lachnospiraceae bacterium]